MPNYCSNYLHFTFPNQTSHSKFFKQFEMAKAADKGFFHAVFPEPDLKDIEHDNIMPDWWVWRNRYWGTKWDTNDNFELEKEDDLSYLVSFDTAWSPPLGVYENMVKIWDFDVKAYYYEPGCDFCGIWDNGVKKSFDSILDFCKEYQNNKPYFNSTALWEELYDQVNWIVDYQNDSDEDDEDD